MACATVISDANVSPNPLVQHTTGTISRQTAQANHQACQPVVCQSEMRNCRLTTS